MQTSAAQDAITTPRVSSDESVERTTVDRPGVSRGTSRVPALIRSTRSTGNCGRPSSATRRARWSSSSGTSRSPASGHSRPPTSSSRSTSAGRWARPSVSAPSGSSSGASSTPSRCGRAGRTTSAPRPICRRFSDDLKHLLVYQKGAFNSPVWFNCGFEARAAVLGLLHQLGQRHDGLDPHAGADRGHAVQVRLGHRLEPLADPLVA